MFPRPPSTISNPSAAAIVSNGESSTAADAPRPPLPEQAAQSRRRDSVPPWLDLSAKTLAVDGNATVPDLLKLIWRSDPRAGKDYIACEMRSGTPHLSLVKSEKTAARSAGASRNAVVQILNNTINQYDLPVHVRDDITEFAEEIRQSLNTESERSERESTALSSRRESTEVEPSERESIGFESTWFDHIGLAPLDLRLPESGSTGRRSTESRSTESRSTESRSTESRSTEPEQAMPLRKDMFGPLAEAFSHVEHAATIGPKEKLPSLLTLTPVSLPGKALVVDGTTALPDLLQLIARSDPKAGKVYFACDMRSGTPHLSLVKSQDTAARSNDPCINALLQILNNTINRYEMTDAMANEVNELRTNIRNLFSTGPELGYLPLNKNAFGALAQMMIGSSGDPSETPRMPVDCLMNLISALDRVALPDAAGAGDALIARVLRDAKRGMLEHPTVDRARDFFDAISRDFTAEGLDDLATLADGFARDMDKLTDRGRLTQRLAERPATIVLSYIDQLNINQLRSDARVRDIADEHREELEILPEDHHAPVRDTAAEREQLKTLVKEAKKKAKAGAITPQEASDFFTAVRNYFRGHGPASEVDAVDECIARLGPSETSPRENQRFARSPRFLDGNPGTSASAARPQFGDPKIEGFFYTRMNENLYGRALDTFLIRALRDNPPTPMKESVEALGRALAQKLEPDWFTYHDFQHYVSTQRGRLPQVKRVTDFIQAQDDAYAALKQALTAPVATGEDCMGVVYLALMVAVRLNHVDDTLKNWADAATHFEESTISHVDATITHHDNHDNKKLVRHAGVALHYQPVPTDPADQPHARYMDQVRPDLENPSFALKTALQHGLPVAGGISGMTSLMTHIVAGLQMEGHRVDPAAIAAALSLHMAAEGRHSLHEVILGMELAKGNAERIQDGLDDGHSMLVLHGRINLAQGRRHAERTRDGSGTSAMRERYVSNYNSFLADLYRGEPGARKSLEDTVWKQVIDYYRTHSHYEGAADGTARTGADEVDRIGGRSGERASG
jgi:hypothetical protein